MIIQLDEEFRIQVTGNNWTLQERRQYGKDSKHHGEDYWIDLGHYPGFQSVLRALPDHLAGCEAIATQKAYLDRWGVLMERLGKGVKR